jgi:methanogenic corrinoid protein MtbC1
MVSDFLEMEGWTSHYIGTNLCFEDILNAVVRYKADLLVMSATIAYNLGAVARTIRVIRTAPNIHAVKILVGGQAFDFHPRAWEQMGADGYGQDADEAVRAASKLLDGDREGKF